MEGDGERSWPRTGAPEQDVLVREGDILPHRSVLAAYLRRRMGSSQDVEDLVQDVYVRVLSTPPGQDVRSWRGFLLRIASNLLIDHHRRRAARMTDDLVPIDDAMADEASASPERVAGGREELARLGEVLKELGTVAREAFLLVRVEGLSHKEAAAQLNITPKAVSHHVERTLAWLAIRLGMPG